MEYKNIYSKLGKLQSTFKSEKDNTNNFGGYKFRNVESMLRKLRPLLDELGLIITFSDVMTEMGNEIVLETTISLIDTESGETFSTNSSVVVDTQMKGCQKSQASGASMTYNHKYSLMSLLAISDESEDPDNGTLMVKSYNERIASSKTITELLSVWSSLDEKQREFLKADFSKRKNELELMCVKDLRMS